MTVTPVTRAVGFCQYLNESAELLRRSAVTIDEGRVRAVIAAIVEAFIANRPLLVCGNGGSASDAMHVTGELVGRFLAERRALNAICLSSNAAVLTAWSNDYSYETVFSRQVEAYGQNGGVLLGISTSGNSRNVIEAFRAAQSLGLVRVALTGNGGGQLSSLADILLDVPARSTPFIQQVHICIYHYICQEVERQLIAGTQTPKVHEKSI